MHVGRHLALDGEGQRRDGRDIAGRVPLPHLHRVRAGRIQRQLAALAIAPAGAAIQRILPAAAAFQAVDAQHAVAAEQAAGRIERALFQVERRTGRRLRVDAQGAGQRVAAAGVAGQIAHLAQVQRDDGVRQIRAGGRRIGGGPGQAAVGRGQPGERAAGQGEGAGVQRPDRLAETDRQPRALAGGQQRVGQRQRRRGRRDVAGRHGDGDAAGGAERAAAAAVALVVGDDPQGRGPT